MFNHLLESSRGDDSNKRSNIEFGEEIGIIEIKMHSLSGARSDAHVSPCFACTFTGGRQGDVVRETVSIQGGGRLRNCFKVPYTGLSLLH